ncbi:MAG: bifunctional 3-phenylpropionate/cinnamic acid dioxygenase ferredoxin subunit [Pseudonocardia sp.]|nr:bifunctional 3-phenylpropionate/cinnamic acid dioxygenase ferredoxin subunit [Pseudonocardia sp.]
MISVGAYAELPVDEALRVEADVPIAVFRLADGSVYAIDDTCTHQRASLADGFVEDCKVECPLHAVCFDLRTGEPDGVLTRTPVRTHQVIVSDGQVYVRLCGEPPPAAGGRTEVDVA